MTNHTLGPWLIDTEDRDICVQLPSGDFLNIATVGCMDHNGIKYYFGPESWANACILRSAPDLLKALEDCSKELRSMIDRHNVQNSEDGSYPYDHQTVVEADKAIAKARGQL